MRTASLKGTHDLIEVIPEVAPRIALIINDVVPLQLAHNILGLELEGGLAHVTLRHKPTEGTLGDKESDLIVSVNPSGVRQVLHTEIGDSPNERLDQHREALSIDRVEAQRLLVDSQLDTTIRIVDEGVFLQRITHTLIITRDERKLFGLETGFVTEGLGLLRTRDKHGILTRTITEVFRREVIAHIVGQRNEELMATRGRRHSTKEVDRDLIITTRKDLTKTGRARVENRLHAREGKKLGADISGINRLDSVLKVLLSNTISVQHREAALVDAHRRTLTTQDFERGRELGLAELSSNTDGAARSVLQATKHGGNETLVSDQTARNERLDLFTSVVGGGPTLHEIGVGIIEGNVTNHVVTEDSNLSGNGLRIVGGNQSTSRRKRHFSS